MNSAAHPFGSRCAQYRLLALLQAVSQGFDRGKPASSDAALITSLSCFLAACDYSNPTTHPITFVRQPSVQMPIMEGTGTTAPPASHAHRGLAWPAVQPLVLQKAQMSELRGITLSMTYSLSAVYRTGLLLRMEVPILAFLTMQNTRFESNELPIAQSKITARLAYIYCEVLSLL